MNHRVSDELLHKMRACTEFVEPEGAASDMRGVIDDLLAERESHAATRARLEALTEACEKALETFEDMGRAARALRRDTWADACYVAADGTRAALDAPEGTE